MSETALVTIQQTQALEVFTAGAMIDPILAEITRQAKDFVPDLTTAKGRKEIASMAHKVAQSKTYLDGIGKALTDEYKEIPKKIDANRKRIRDYLDNLKDEVRAPLTAWEAEEKARVAALHSMLAKLQALAVIATGATAADISTALAMAEATVIDDSWAELAADAAIEKDKVIKALRPALAARLQYEAEQAELARLRAEQAKREAEERDRRIAEEAAAKAKRDAEEAAARAAAEVERKAKAEREAAERRELELKLAAEKAERERLEAIERAEREKAEAAARAERERLAAVEAERRRVESERQAKEAEERRRAEDEARQFAIHSDIIADLATVGIAKEQALAIIDAVRTGNVRHITIRY